MKANANNLLRLMSATDKKFIIPVYQRSYSWKKKNCEQLLEDLKGVYENGYTSHFFGSLVYIADNDGSGEKLIIIDGQQRITTVSLLLLAFYKYIKNHPNVALKSINAEGLKNFLLTDEYSGNEKKLRLKLVQGDDIAYDSLIEGRKSIENSAITVNYNYFYSELEKMSPEELDGLYDSINRLEIVAISLELQNGDKPQYIFESLNSTGIDLETVDKIRNYVLMDMNYKEQETFYKNFWEPLEKLVTHYELNKFIRYYLSVKTRQLYDEKNLYLKFKLYCGQNNISIVPIFRDMLKYAEYYRMFLEPENASYKYGRILKRIGKLDVKSCAPLIMDLFEGNSKDHMSDDELKKSLEIIENFLKLQYEIEHFLNQLTS